MSWIGNVKLKVYANAYLLKGHLKSGAHLLHSSLFVFSLHVQHVISENVQKRVSLFYEHKCMLYYQILEGILS